MAVSTRARTSAPCRRRTVASRLDVGSDERRHQVASRARVLCRAFSGELRMREPRSSRDPRLTLELKAHQCVPPLDDEQQNQKQGRRKKPGHKANRKHDEDPGCTKKKRPVGQHVGEGN